MQTARKLQLLALALALTACVFWVRQSEGQQPTALGTGAQDSTALQGLHLGSKMHQDLKRALNLQLTREKFEKRSQEVQGTEKELKLVFAELQAAAEAKAMAEKRRVELQHLQSPKLPQAKKLSPAQGPASESRTQTASSTSQQGKSQSHARKGKEQGNASLSSLIKGLMGEVKDGVPVRKVHISEPSKGKTHQVLHHQYVWPQSTHTGGPKGAPVDSETGTGGGLGKEMSKMEGMQREVGALSRIIDKLVPAAQAPATNAVTLPVATSDSAERGKLTLNEAARREMEVAIERSDHQTPTDS